jgi:dihydrofolate reductase
LKVECWLNCETVPSCGSGLTSPLHRHAAENIAQADALLFGRVTYEMMEAGWRGPAPTGARPDWMEPFARTIDAARKYVVSSTLDRVDWNAELVRGDLGEAVQRLRRDPTIKAAQQRPQGLSSLGRCAFGW